MKREQPLSYEEDLLRLQKKFKRPFDRQSVKIVYDFAQQDTVKTNRILTIASRQNNPMLLIKTLIDKPEDSQLTLDQYQAKYIKLFGEKDINGQADTAQLILKQQDLFEQIAQNCLFNVMEYLDPYAYTRLSLCNRRLHAISQCKSSPQYYRRLCKAFIFQFDQPEQCRFGEVRDYALTHPFELGPNMAYTVVYELRRFVWQSTVRPFTFEKEYFLSFGNYKKLFQNCPRIHLNGFYVCKHKYIKFGEKSIGMMYAPVHIVHYYRYIRFLRDGTVLYQVSNRKFTNEQVSEQLGSHNIGNLERECILGEFVQDKETVYIKTARANTIFSFQMRIGSTEGCVQNQLSVVRYYLEMVDRTRMTQSLFDSTRQSLNFLYVPFDKFRTDQTDDIAACCL